MSREWYLLPCDRNDYTIEPIYLFGELKFTDLLTASIVVVTQKSNLLDITHYFLKKANALHYLTTPLKKKLSHYLLHSFCIAA